MDSQKHTGLTRFLSSHEGPGTDSGIHTRLENKAQCCSWVESGSNPGPPAVQNSRWWMAGKAPVGPFALFVQKLYSQELQLIRLVSDTGSAVYVSTSTCSSGWLYMGTCIMYIYIFMHIIVFLVSLFILIICLIVTPCCLRPSSTTCACSSSWLSVWVPVYICMCIYIYICIHAWLDCSLWLFIL